MAGLVPAIHVFPFLLDEQSKQDVDARDRRGHDGVCCQCGYHRAARDSERKDLSAAGRDH
jgi:hypothetical protein